MSNNKIFYTKGNNSVKSTNQPDSNNTKYYTVNEVIVIFKVSRRTLQRWRDEGLISFRKIRGKIYFTMSDLEQFMERNYVPAFAKTDHNFLTSNAYDHGKKK